MNPGVLGGGAPAQVQTNRYYLNYAAVPTSETAMLPTPDLTPEMPPATEFGRRGCSAPAFADTEQLGGKAPLIRCPSMRSEVVAEAPVLAAPAMDAPVEAPVVDASVPTVSPETVVDVPAEVAHPSCKRI